MFNCAIDLNIERWCNELDLDGYLFPRFIKSVEYVQIGLIDGPGNTPANYHAALLKLCSLIQADKQVMVHDHDAGSRTVAVVIMALHAMYRRGWDYWLDVIRDKMGNIELTPHPEHRRAFNRINWRLISSVIDG